MIKWLLIAHHQRITGYANHVAVQFVPIIANTDIVEVVGAIAFATSGTLVEFQRQGTRDAHVFIAAGTDAVEADHATLRGKLFRDNRRTNDETA